MESLDFDSAARRVVESFDEPVDRGDRHPQVESNSRVVRGFEGAVRRFDDATNRSRIVVIGSHDKVAVWAFFDNSGSLNRVGNGATVCPREAADTEVRPTVVPHHRTDDPLYVALLEDVERRLPRRPARFTVVVG